jgi:hypothetical protein
MVGTMEELFELRSYLEQRDYDAALALLGEMEEMSRDDKRHKICSHAIILLLHLIKQEAEQRSSRSWDFSIRNAVRAITWTNKRRKAGGWYLDHEELRAILDEAYQPALEQASLEVFRGMYDDVQLGARVDEARVKQRAFALVAPGREPGTETL